MQLNFTSILIFAVAVGGGFYYGTKKEEKLSYMDREMIRDNVFAYLDLNNGLEVTEPLTEEDMNKLVDDLTGIN